MTDAPLTAVRRLLPAGHAVDPYVLAGPDGILFDTGGRVLVGLGTARSLPLTGGLDDADAVRRVRATLADVAVDDELDDAGSPVIAFGSLPFDRAEPSALVLPELVYGREADGREWVTSIGTAAPAALDPRDELDRRRDRRAAAPPTDDGRVVGLVPRYDDDHFLGLVAEAVDRIARDEVAKVVLARQVEVRFDRPPDLPSLLGRWRRLEPTCTVFSVPAGDGQFVGASPELLVARHGDRVHCRPLAGTSGQEVDGDGDSLRHSSKDTREHRFVAEALGDALAPICTELDVPDAPVVIRLHNVNHLGTPIEGVLAPGAEGPPTALELVAVVHPTPAVGGVPRAAALAAIAELEGADRGHYAGPVGWVDGGGDGMWVVGIRAALVRGSSAELLAGVGIVRDSQPVAELDETELKLTAVLDALASNETVVSRD